MSLTLKRIIAKKVLTDRMVRRMVARSQPISAQEWTKLFEQHCARMMPHGVMGETPRLCEPFEGTDLDFYLYVLTLDF